MGPGVEVPRSEVGAFIDQGVPKAQAVVIPPAASSRKDQREDRALNDPERKALKDSTGPPDKDDWLDFFSRIILRVGMESYVDYVFRNIDENLLTERELDQIKPTRELREQIATPFAVYCTKNKWTRKHGREIVAAADSVEALVNLGIWIRRVNRIARRYKPQRAQRPRVSLRPEGVSNVSDGQDQGQGREEYEGSRNGHVGTGFTIINPGSG